MEERIGCRYGWRCVLARVPVLAGPTSTGGSPLLSHLIFPKAQGSHPSSSMRRLGDCRQAVLGCLAQG
jgi:hypothetical protein